MLKSHLESDGPIQEWSEIGQELGVELLIKRDDLLPFPLSGNKYRKLLAEYKEKGWRSDDVLISTGGIESNHCRTLAWFGALLGCHVHLVLHGEALRTDENNISLRILSDLGATYEIVESAEISARLSEATGRYRDYADRVWRVPGGAHTMAGVRAFRDSARKTLGARDIDVVVVASGTGATQAGIILGAMDVSSAIVIGVSVARSSIRGAAAVHECLKWFYDFPIDVRFDDRFVDGGYAKSTELTQATVRWAWRKGLPLDETYTGKAFTGLRHLVATGEIRRNSRVLFWHTGGLSNYIASVQRSWDG